MKKKLVLPGDFLSTEEEFIAGKNAFESEGNLYSSSTGEVEENSKTKEISVKPSKELSPVKKGSTVYGRVELVKENSVSVSLFPNPEEEGRQIISQTTAMLPIRNVSQDYVKSLRDFFRIGDIIKARVSKTIPAGTDIETNRPDLGVIKAFCSRCRHPLHLFGSRLRCMNCGSSETRKIAKGYLVK